MPTAAHRSLADITRQINDLGTAVPFVVNHRLGRMALAGAQPSPVDSAEFAAMGLEKMNALQESMLAMSLASLDASQKLAATMAHWAVMPWSLTPTQTAWSLMTDTPLAVLQAGLSPVSERAGENARRLAQPRPDDEAPSQSASTSPV